MIRATRTTIKPHPQGTPGYIKMPLAKRYAYLTLYHNLPHNGIMLTTYPGLAGYLCLSENTLAMMLRDAKRHGLLWFRGMGVDRLLVWDLYRCPYKPSVMAKVTHLAKILKGPDLEWLMEKAQQWEPQMVPRRTWNWRGIIKFREQMDIEAQTPPGWILDYYASWNLGVWKANGPVQLTNALNILGKCYDRGLVEQYMGEAREQKIFSLPWVQAQVENAEKVPVRESSAPPIV